MRIFALMCLASSAAAFTMAPKKVVPSTTALEASRRDVLFGAAITVAAAVSFAPNAALANIGDGASHGSTFFVDESKIYEPAQMHTGDRLDINAAFVVRTRA